MSVADLSGIERRAYELAEAAGYWVIIRRSSRHSISHLHIPDPEYPSYGNPDDPYPVCSTESLGAAAEESINSKPFGNFPVKYYPVCGHCTNRLQKREGDDDE